MFGVLQTTVVKHDTDDALQAAATEKHTTQHILFMYNTNMDLEEHLKDFQQLKWFKLDSGIILFVGNMNFEG